METMKLADIKVTNPYLRINTDVESLKKSIETVGLINPLTINEKNQLIAGGRRYQALMELGQEEAQVSRVDLSDLEQELISIDENLVRKPLDKLELEKCLNRGREIYEELNPEATKIDVNKKALSAQEKKQEKEEDEQDSNSFAAVTSEKTGLSKSVIKNAIKRDAQSSEMIKEARGSGELSASQVNEIIKLEKSEQERILPFVKEKTVKDLRRIVNLAREEGLNAAIAASHEEEEIPKEMKQLEAMVKKCNKLFAKVIIENMDVSGEEMDKISGTIQKLKKQCTDYLNLYAGGDGEALSGAKTREAFESQSMQ